MLATADKRKAHDAGDDRSAQSHRRWFRNGLDAEVVKVVGAPEVSVSTQQKSVAKIPRRRMSQRQWKQRIPQNSSNCELEYSKRAATNAAGGNDFVDLPQGYDFQWDLDPNRQLNCPSMEILPTTRMAIFPTNEMMTGMHF